MDSSRRCTKKSIQDVREISAGNMPKVENAADLAGMTIADSKNLI
jgi:hypothetical protein